MTMAIPWHKMTERERLVWTSTYAAHANNPADAIRLANQVVQALHELDVDNNAYSGPEYEAARRGQGLMYEEFRAWYPVALKLSMNNSIQAKNVSEEACQRAYDVYRQCSTDFY